MVQKSENYNIFFLLLRVFIKKKAIDPFPLIVDFRIFRYRANYSSDEERETTASNK